MALAIGPKRMRLATSTMPRAVGKYLIPREAEGQLIAVRRHPAVLIPPTATALGGLSLALALSTAVIHNNVQLLQLGLVWVLSLLLILRLLLKAARWLVNYFVVTSERLLLISGSATRKIETVQLTKITDVSFERSTAGRLLGYGRVHSGIGRPAQEVAD